MLQLALVATFSGWRPYLDCNHLTVDVHELQAVKTPPARLPSPSFSLGPIAVAIVAACAIGVAAAATVSTAASSRLRGQNFFSNCYFSHIAADDPIVYPRQPGVSHSHTFFGSKSTDAASTVKSLRTSPTTCRLHADTAAYWVPTLYSGGAVVKPTKGSAYFVLKSIGAMRAFPAGLKIVAGNAHARTSQDRNVTFWSCSMLEGAAFRWTTPRSCAKVNDRRHSLLADDRKALIQLDVIFPDCWDGRNLDSADHKSHMAYSHDWTCPRSHPVKVPRLRFIVTYPIQEAKNLSFASGPIYTAHADFFNGWKQAALNKLVGDCFFYRASCNLPPK
jgi:hypothetical protein